MIPRPERVEAVTPAENPQTIDHIPQILGLIQANAETLSYLTSINEAVVSVLGEVVKPPKPKKWQCTVGRRGGEIATIDIVEN
jgi:predicted transcriptional regulator